MNIAFLTSEYPPLCAGGIGTSIRNLAQALVGQGHTVTVLGWGAKAEFEDRGVQVRFLGHTSVPKAGWLLNRRLAQRELNRLVRRNKLDIVEVQDWCGLSAGMHLDCPVTIRCHGTATYFGYLLRERVRPTVRWAERIALNQAKSIIAVSRFTAETTQRLFGLREAIGVIPNGIDLLRFQPADPDETEANTILYLGTLVRKKGILDLCRIFSRVVDARPAARLRLIGRDARDKSTGSSSTWELCKELLSPAARERAEYVGAQPYDVVQDSIQRAAVCVFPSYAEALPLSWLEAMACAKPVVAYDIGWAPEIIDAGVSGILIKLGDVESFAEHLLTVLGDQAHAKGLGVAARRRVERDFASAVVAESTLIHYRSVIAD